MRFRVRTTFLVALTLRYLSAKAHVARREAPAVSGNGYGRHRFALFGAPTPSGSSPMEEK